MNNIYSTQNNALSNALLICPLCNKHIPELEFHYSNLQISVCLNCICLKESMLLAVKEFKNQLVQKQTEERKCSNDNHCQSDSKGEKYCQECSCWLCQNCFQNNEHNHEEGNSNHTFTNHEVSVICILHKQIYSFYCKECRANICNDCCAVHEKHQLVTLQAVDVDLKTECYFNAVMSRNKQAKDDLIVRLSLDPNANSQHDEIKKDIESIFNNNRAINEELKSLFLSFLFTVSTFKQYKLYQLTKLSQSLSINTNEFSIKDRSIEETYSVLSDYLQTNYLFIQVNKNKKCLLTLNGHNHNVFHIIQLSSGLLASGSADRTIKIWNISTKECKSTLSGHTHSVCCLLQLKDGRLASGSYRKIKFWNLETNECQDTIENAHNHFAYCLIQLKDSRLVSVSEDGTTKFWDTKTLQCTTTITDNSNSNSLLCVLELNDGRLATTLFDGTIQIFNDKVNEFKSIDTNHKNYIKSLIQIDDGRLVSGSYKSIKVWNSISHKCEATLIGHNHFVFSLLYLSTGLLASASGDNTIKYWNMEANECIATLIGHSWYVYSLVELTNGKLASGSFDNTVKIWDS